MTAPGICKKIPVYTKNILLEVYKSIFKEMISLKKWTFSETPENKGNKLRKMPQAYFYRTYSNRFKCDF